MVNSRCPRQQIEEAIMIRHIGMRSTGISTMVVILSGGGAWAQEKFRYDHGAPPSSSRYVQQHIIDVGDVPGHQVRVQELQRNYTKDHPTIMGVKVVESWNRGFSDYVNGVGPATGYGVWVLEDGNKIFSQYIGTSYTEMTATGSRRGTYHGTTRLTGGTGKFAAIRGVLTDTVEFDTDPKSGYNRPTSQGEYWLEK
jgi:hypothetical protein